MIWWRKLDLNQRSSGYEPDEIGRASLFRINKTKMVGAAGFEPAFRPDLGLTGV